MVDSGELAIFRHVLSSVVEEMGVTLQRTAYSMNIKIRRDHTCALFDADRRSLAQHDVVPQHIGSLVSVVPRPASTSRCRTKRQRHVANVRSTSRTAAIG